jgi:hypothetical protein
MKRLVFSLLAAVALSGVFLAEAVAAFPPNDGIPSRRAERSIEKENGRRSLAFGGRSLFESERANSLEVNPEKLALGLPPPLITVPQRLSRHHGRARDLNSARL